MFRKTWYRIAAGIVAAMVMASSPAAAGYMSAYAAEAEEDAGAETGAEAEKEEKEEKKDKKEEKSADGATAGATTETASVEEPIIDPAPHEEMSIAEQVANPETSVQEALETEMSMISDDDIILIRFGYRFDDGSFDEWTRGTGFIVGARYILTRQYLVDKSAENDLLKDIMNSERNEKYRSVGYDLRSTDTTVKHLAVFVTDRFGTSPSRTRSLRAALVCSSPRRSWTLPPAYLRTYRRSAFRKAPSSMRRRPLIRTANSRYRPSTERSLSMKNSRQVSRS